MHLLLQRCSGRVRPPSAHNAHDTMLSDANASRSQYLAPSRVRRGTAMAEFELGRRNRRANPEIITTRFTQKMEATAYVIKVQTPPIDPGAPRASFATALLFLPHIQRAPVS